MPPTTNFCRFECPSKQIADQTASPSPVFFLELDVVEEVLSEIDNGSANHNGENQGHGCILTQEDSTASMDSYPENVYFNPMEQYSHSPVNLGERQVNSSQLHSPHQTLAPVGFRYTQENYRQITPDNVCDQSHENSYNTTSEDESFDSIEQNCGTLMNTGAIQDRTVSSSSHSPGNCGGKLKCRHCSQEFLHKSQLDTHMRIHTGEKPFKCEQCSRGFSQNGTLTRHKKRHNKEKTYKCAYACGKDFTTEHERKVHQLTHLDEEERLVLRVNCEHCTKSFAHRRHMLRHFNTSHQ